MFSKNNVFKDIYIKRSKIATEALRKNGFKSFYIDRSKEAAMKILSLIPNNATIGIGSSMTIREIGLVEILKNKGHVIFEDWRKSITKTEKIEIRKAALTSDIYLTSSNAITLKGQLVNIDRTGNRVSAMIFGPKEVIIVAGANKLVDTLEDAFSRIKNISCPFNGRRLNLNTPCSLTGRCADCASAERMCNVSTIIEKRPILSEITVCIVCESLGF